MKTLPTNLATHIATRSTTLAMALKITREDGEIFGFTTHDISDVVSSITYSANPGLQATSIKITSGVAVGNLELTTLHDGTVFTTADILGGVWRNAAFTIFRYNFAALTDGIDTLLAGTFGEFEIRQNAVVIELRDLRQYLQQEVGDASSKTCRARLGDSRCGVVLTGSPNAFTVFGSVTSVTSNQVFRDSARAEAVNWFDEGELEFTSGPNTGLRAKVKSYAANGTFTLAIPLLGTVAIGHSFTAIAGCRKRREEDCRDKFNNVLNFVGEPDRKGIDNLTERPQGDV
jgi:uncharacterized phage protein (TIGR02218 family)